MSALPIFEDGLVIVGDEAYTAEEWAALSERAAKQAAYAQRPEAKAKQAATFGADR